MQTYHSIDYIPLHIFLFLNSIILILFYIFLTWRNHNIWYALKFSSASKMNCNEKHQYFTDLLNNNRQLNINIEFYQPYLWKQYITCVVSYRKTTIRPVPITANNKISKTTIYEGFLCDSPCFKKALNPWYNIILETGMLPSSHWATSTYLTQV